MRYGFMAGCSLSSSSPKRISQIIAYLKGYYPDLALIQACCGKPTKYIGDEDRFRQRFQQLVETVQSCEVEELIVACQGCLATMNHEAQFSANSLWVLMAELGLPEELKGKAQDSDVVFSIQDSCPTKDLTEIHDAIRFLLSELGYQVAKNRLSGKNTLCCGMGGMCGVTNPTLAKDQATKRVQEFKTTQIVTYCASCTSAMILGGGQAWHLLDLIFGDVVYQTDKSQTDPLSQPLSAWLNRYRSKKVIQKG
ncbi:(Fe-S)-binding protein [Vagococcus sp. BWB3-3]|uniref:(Fe-S)-binding protein n=1 Tax=Vagococcus allomyrinae TaxID=2794353 RepID=A0A940SWJ2_9ENTE|nr:(Fe-S)-binding protein [Vagococcus allomyrinae]MBP1042191.1 (Fe-S)-binding protein [Vagococcus allomyrinae]